MRLSPILSAVTVLAAAAHAQCYPGTAAPLTYWTESGGFVPANATDDEGMTGAIPLGFAFPMAGAVGTLDQAWASINGHIFLTDSSLALASPVPAGISFGVDTLAEMRGDGVGDVPRIAVVGDDHEGAPASIGTYEIRVDSSIPGQITFSWIDIQTFSASTSKPMWSFACTLFSSGVVEMRYGTLTTTETRYVGISIGNGVGTTTSPEFDLSALADSGIEGLIYQAFGSTDPFDLNNSSLLFTPNGTGGYTSIVTATGICLPASHTVYGEGCYEALPSSVLQLFASSAEAKANLDGNGVLYAPTGTGYTASWVPAGATAYVPPSGGATTLVIGVANGSASLSPSVPFPIPGGSAPVLTVSENGIVTCAATANNGTDTTPSATDMTTNTTATELAFYGWRDFSLSEAGSGPIVYEEVTIGSDTVLCITWNGVESLPTGANPTTQQFQFNLTSGAVSYLVPSFDPGTSTSDTLVGCTLAGLGRTPDSSSLSTDLPITIAPDVTPTLYELFADSPSAKAALDGNALLLIPTASGYISTWLPGGASAYVAPGGGATTLTMASNANVQVTPSVPFPSPVGVIPTISVSENGIVTAASVANNGTDTTPSGTDLVGSAAPELGFYSWRDFTVNEAGSGPIQSEEVVIGSDTVLCLTWNGVEVTPTTSATPTTLQFQLNLSNGAVTILWVSYDTGTSTSDTLVGVTLPGTSTADTDFNPGSTTLSTAPPQVLVPIQQPLTMTASPAPVFTPGGSSVPMTWTLTNVPDAAPGIALGILIFSVTPLPAPGVDLGFLGAPGCAAFIATLDVQLPFVGANPGHTQSIPITFPQPLNPGDVFASQAIALFPPNSLPNGQNAFGMLTSNGILSEFQHQ